MDPQFLIYAVVFLAWVMGGVVGGATGLGAVMVAMPILTTVMTPADAILVSCITGLYVCSQLAYTYRKSALWGDLRDLLIGIIPGCVLGVFILKTVPVPVLQLMISAMLSCFVLLQFFRKAATYRLPDSTPIAVAVGIICGVVSTSVAMMGGPLGAYVLLKHWEPNRARANMCVLFAIAAVASVAVQATAGMYTMPLFQLSIIGMVGGALGQIVGVKLGRRISSETLIRIILVFLSIVAVVLAFQAFQ